jgi:hypothetical protein
MVGAVRCVLMLALVSCGKSSPSSSGSSGSSSVSPSDVIAEQAKTFRSGWSAQPASPGPLFGGLTVGGPDEMTKLYEKLHGQFSTEYVWTPTGDKPELMAMLARSRVVISVVSRSGKISRLGLWTNDERDVGCPTDFASEIRTAWKTAPHATDDGLEIWLDAAQQVRALLKVGDQCRLEFERYEPEDTWLEKVGRIDLVGSPASRIASEIAPIFGARTIIDQNGQSTWTDRGCGFGGGVTLIEARTDKDRIVSVKAATYVTDATFRVVLAKLVASRGQPTEVTGLTMRRLEWTTGTPLRVDYDDGQLHVTSGVFPAP